MRFPSKVVPVAESTFAHFIPILEALEGKRYTPASLYMKIKPAEKRPAVEEYLDALTCLYALGKIELDPELGVLQRAR